MGSLLSLSEEPRSPASWDSFIGYSLLPHHGLLRTVSWPQSFCIASLD
jgi:hypothetical protein